MECHIPPVCEKKSSRPSALTPGLFGRFRHRASFPWKRFLVHLLFSVLKDMLTDSNKVVGDLGKKKKKEVMNIESWCTVELDSKQD